jgi:hypothetical protein
MSLNGISTSTYKADRQVAKLNLAQAKRQGRIVDYDGTWSGSVDPTKPYYRARNNYDITQLPTVYTAGDNDTNNVTDNANPGGLVYGRPWTSTAPTPSYTLQFREWIGPADPSGHPGNVITTCNEGDIVFFEIYGSNIPDDPTAYLQFSGANITSNDAVIFLGPNLLDPIPFNYSGDIPPETIGAPIGIYADNTTEGNETLTLSWVVNSSTVATASITIVDTSQNP